MQHQLIASAKKITSLHLQFKMAETLTINNNGSKEEKYQSLLPQLKALVEGETDLIANLANICAALKFGMDFFWVGFYLVKSTSEGEEQLVLGPFQGPLACSRIAKGKGVCGKSWRDKEIILVPDVDQFPGHIACSTMSKSEIVLPIMNRNDEVFLVLDVDSDHLNDFDLIDKKYLQQVVEIIQNNSFA